MTAGTPVSEREVGRIEQTLSDLQHRTRNDRQVVLILQDEVESLRRDLDRTKTRVYTALSVAFVVATGLAWVVETFLVTG